MAVQTINVVTGVCSSVFLLYTMYYVKVFWMRRYCRSQNTMKGKTVVVTGGDSGIGKETAIELARRGARVILACRTTHKGIPAALEVQQRSGNGNVVYRNLDLCSQKSIHEFVKLFLKEESRLDVLINNAGLGATARGLVTVEGFDMVFGVNYFGHFLVSMLLLNKLKASAPSRIVNVASEAHHLANRLDLTPVDDEGKRFPGLVGYATSNLAKVMFTRELERRLRGTGITAYAVHPGRVNSNMWRRSLSARGKHWVNTFIGPVIWLLLISEEAGAQTTIYCAVEEGITHFSGRYFDNCDLATASELAKDDTLCRKLWEISCQAVGYGGD
ncbi:retinol dehydrogenase 11-like [Amphiura filiformis]|uniref:retinol dehydrogenase 11-like n=1 Tax=Amphiura filiformis TaxID=82378 RepID=UPI003B221634